ncbi:cellulose synthase operon protein YhjQ/BcsQ [Actinomyces sp. zg328]|uniref:cellulose synthase operon protein YhjQ/BcsQ n=1 Tax=Actinomyces sp. zg328 TaxID=2609287 RepID=UPI00135BD9D3|nr:cellulose synthase operon protein YhjQ/BcsQ [Actinomyces sp. zg328]
MRHAAPRSTHPGLPALRGRPGAPAPGARGTGGAGGPGGVEGGRPREEDPVDWPLGEHEEWGSSTPGGSAGDALADGVVVAVLLRPGHQGGPPEEPLPGWAADIVLACTGLEPQALVCSYPEAPRAASDLVQRARALRRRTGATHALILVPDDLPALAESLSQRPDISAATLHEALDAPQSGALASLIIATGHPGRARVIALTGARGGLGTTTILLLLARAMAAAGRGVAIVDLDPAGGIDLMMGEGVRPGLRWRDLPEKEGSYHPERLAEALPRWSGIRFLTGDPRGGPVSAPQAAAALAAIEACHDVVLVDLPRGAEPPPEAEVVIVMGCDVRSAEAAESIVARLGGGEPGPEDGSRPVAGSLGRERAEGPRCLGLVLRQIGEDLAPEEITGLTGAKVLGRAPSDHSVASRIARGDDPGRSRGPLRRAIRPLAAHLLEGDDAVLSRAPWEAELEEGRP